MKLNDELIVSIDKSIDRVYPLPESNEFRISVMCYPHNKIDPFIKTISKKLNELISTVLDLKGIGSDKDLSCLSTLEKFLEYVNNDKEEGVYCIKYEPTSLAVMLGRGGVLYKDIQLLKLDICEQEEVEKYHYVFNNKCDELVLEKVMNKPKVIKLTDVLTNEQFGDLIPLEIDTTPSMCRLSNVVRSLIMLKEKSPAPKVIEEIYFDEQELDDSRRIIDEVALEHGYFMRCKDCNDPYYITYAEENWYKIKNFNVPKRCKACRNKRRNKK